MWVCISKLRILCLFIVKLFDQQEVILCRIMLTLHIGINVCTTKRLYIYRFSDMMQEPGSKKVTILLYHYSYQAKMSIELTKIEKLGMLLNY